MNPYATDKLAAHPDVLRSLRGAGQLITVHLMPQNVCNQRCSFCSYRMPENKNSEAFDEGKHIPWAAMGRLLDDFKAMGVRGIELTGGGEPLAYPKIAELCGELRRRAFAVSMVTNGTLYQQAGAGVVAMGDALRWVRVSIDAATAKTYATMRQTPAHGFGKAWAMVQHLAETRSSFHPEFRLGVGFVLSNENLAEVLPFVEMAKDAGADNVRLSLTFSDKHLDYFEDRTALHQAVEDSRDAAADFTDDTFTVHNLIPKRYWEQEHPAQDYRRCPTKDVLCVVEGEGKVYTCCTFTGSKRGLYGNFMEHPGGFRGLWEENAERRRTWDCRAECPVACLYRDRNLAMNKLIDEPPIHTEFI